MGQCGGQEVGRALHICGDEVVRQIDRAVDMAFRRQMDHRVGPVRSENRSQARSIPNVAVNECVTFAQFKRRQRRRLRRIG